MWALCGYGFSIMIRGWTSDPMQKYVKLSKQALIELLVARDKEKMAEKTSAKLKMSVLVAE